MERWLVEREVGELYEAEMRLRRADGEHRWFLIRTAPLRDGQGNLVKWYGVSIDIEDRKRAEEALREAEQKYHDIFENAGEGIFQSTPEGKYIAANPALARMYRFASPEELIHSCQDISRQVYVDPTLREEFRRQIEEQGAIRGFEHEVFRQDGSTFWISVNARTVRDEQGAIQYYEGTAQDITERKAAEEKLKATSVHLRALSARLQSAREAEGTRIAREVHDELGSALTSLKWDLEEIDKQLSTPLEPLALVALREKFQTPMKLADLAISAIRKIASELRPSVLDDLGLAAAIEWQGQQFQSRTGIVCVCDCSLERVELNEEQSTAVFRILQEALTNVLRHAQATKVEIKISKENGYFGLSVSDNGKGIMESVKSEQQSLGILGMRERAHLIGGEIDIKGVEGKGTVVIVHVPLSGQDTTLKMTR
jgi:PAS domain S-box-containing protein